MAGFNIFRLWRRSNSAPTETDSSPYVTPPENEIVDPLHENLKGLSQEESVLLPESKNPVGSSDEKKS